MVLFFWIVVSNIPRLLSNAIMIMFARLVSNIPRLLSNAMMIMFARLLSARFGQDMDKPLATHVLKTKVKISLFIVLFTDTVHPLLLMVLFTPNFCLFKRGCPLSLRKNSFSKTSFFLEAFFRESSIFLVSTTTLQSL